MMFLGLLVLVSSLTVYTYNYYLGLEGQSVSLPDNSESMSLLRQNNSSLESQLETLALRVAELDVQLVALKESKVGVGTLVDDLTAQYRLPTDTSMSDFLPHLSASVAWANNQDGVGGSEQLANNLALTAVVGSSRDVVRGLHRDLNRLLVEADDTRYYWDSLKINLDQAHSIVAATPMFLPLDGRISAIYGNRLSPFGGRSVEIHRGVDIPAPMGTLVRIPADGTVISVDYAGGYGLMVVVNHGYGLITRYAHLLDSLVKVGDRVKRGQSIARCGNSGRSTGSHLHYETVLGGTAVDPFRLLPVEVVQGLVYKDGISSP